MFSPDKFDREIGLEQFSGDGLELEEMQRQGIIASFIRQDLIERAQKVAEPFQFDQEANERYKSRLQKKLDNNVHGHERYYLKEMLRDMPEYHHQIKGYKRRKLKDLTVEEKLEVVGDVFIKKDYHDNICARYNIGREQIKTLLKNFKRDPHFLRKLHEKEAAR